MFIVCVIIFKVDFSCCRVLQFNVHTRHKHNLRNQFYVCATVCKYRPNRCGRKRCAMYADIHVCYSFWYANVCVWARLCLSFGFGFADLGWEQNQYKKWSYVIVFLCRVFSALLFVSHTLYVLLNSWLSWQFYYFWLSYRRSFKCHAFFTQPTSNESHKYAGCTVPSRYDVDENYWICLFTFVVFFRQHCSDLLWGV